MQNRIQKHELWKQRIEAWKQSGQSQESFCQQQGLKPSTFGYWYSKFKEDSSKAMPFIALKPSAGFTEKSIELRLSSGISVSWQVKDFNELAAQLQSLGVL
jgi:hypothetical protein